MFILEIFSPSPYEKRSIETEIRHFIQKTWLMKLCERIDVYYNPLNKDMNVNKEREKNIIGRYTMHARQTDKFNYKLTLSRAISIKKKEEKQERINILSI
jgi:hypothetical protein